MRANLAHTRTAASKFLPLFLPFGRYLGVTNYTQVHLGASLESSKDRQTFASDCKQETYGICLSLQLCLAWLLTFPQEIALFWSMNLLLPLFLPLFSLRGFVGGAR